jgi:F-type H+-transporting ATPase subunit gamma
MKTVAGSRLKAAEARKDQAVPFLQATAHAFGEYPLPESSQKNLVIAFTSDRGLCGSLNSSVVRFTTEVIRKLTPETVELIIFGEKGRGSLVRSFPENISLVVTELDKKTLSFTDFAVIADYIASRQYDTITIVHNKYLNALSFQTREMKIAQKGLILKSDVVRKKYFDGEENMILGDFYHYNLASILYATVVEGLATELAQRRAAMDGASRNAKEMLRILGLAYNRKRQAGITKELIEIISGAAGLAEEGDE